MYPEQIIIQCLGLALLSFLLIKNLVVKPIVRKIKTIKGA